MYNFEELKKKKKASKMDIKIPGDIIIQILVQLPAKSVFKLRCVCKYWFNLISDPVFIKLHLHHHQQHDQTNHLILVFDYSPSADQTLLHSLNYNNNSIDIDAAAAKWVSTRSPINYVPLGSCNGLLCIFTSKSFRSSGDRIGLLNPCTKQCKVLPHHEQVVPPTYKFRFFTYGFGYDCINDDYKVVKNETFTLKDDFYGDSYYCVTVVNVYTLGTNSWRRIEDLFPYQLIGDGGGVLVGGALYWRAIKFGSVNLDIIVGFQLWDEVYVEISLPPHCPQYYMDELVELNGCLSIFQRTDHSTIEVWTLMNSDDWVHLFTVAEPKLVKQHQYGDCIDCIPLGVCNEDGELLMKVENKELVWYNPRDGKTRFFAQIPSSVGYRSYREIVKYTFVKYTETLVSLNLGDNHREIII